MAEPISLAQAKLHLRVDHDTEDSLIEGMIADARSWVEEYTGQSLVSQSRALVIDSFEDRLRAWPITSVAEVSYYDRDGTLRQVSADAYELANITRPARLQLKGSARWPVAATGRQKIIVDVVAGYADPSDIPGGMRRAMYGLLWILYRRLPIDDEAAKAARTACGPSSKVWSL